MEHIQELLSDAHQHVHETLNVSDETIRRLHDRVLRALPKKQNSHKKWIPAAVAAVTVAAAAVAVMPRIIEKLPGTVESGRGGEQTRNAPAPEGANTTMQATDSPNLQNDPVVQQMSDAEKLTLLNPIPWGASYQQTKQVLPGLRELSPEGGLDSLGEQGLTEAMMPLTIFGKDIKLQINFRSNRMYAIHYALEAAEPAVAADLQSKVIQFYSGQFGPPATGKEKDGATSAMHTTWNPQPQYQITMTNSLQANHTAYLTWGFELAESEQAKWASQHQKGSPDDSSP